MDTTWMDDGLTYGWLFLLAYLLVCQKNSGKFPDSIFPEKL